MSADNFTNAVRELWLPGTVKQVWTAIPMYTALMMKKRVTVKGGKQITRAVDMAEMDGVAQEYGPNTPLSSAQVEFLERPHWHWKKFQIPIEYDEEEESEGRGGAATAPVDLVEEKTQKGLRAARLKLNQQMYNYPSSTSDDDLGFQGIPDALEHDATYGGLARAIGTTTRTWWQGRSLAATYADRNTAAAASIENFRIVKAEVLQYGDGKPGGLLAVCGSLIFRKLQAQVEGSAVNTRFGQTSLGRYGFSTLTIDGIQVVEDTFLNTKPWGTSSGYDTRYWFFMLTLDTWELRLFPGRDLSRVTPFEYQGKIINGYDKFLARVPVKGNLVCYRPNGNFWASNWSL